MMERRHDRRTRSTAGGGGKIWDLALFVSGTSAESILAFQTLTKLCDKHLVGKYRVEIVDVELHPDRARKEGIVEAPTLVKYGPPPALKLAGDLYDFERLAEGLGLIRRHPG